MKQTDLKESKMKQTDLRVSHIYTFLKDIYKTREYFAEKMHESYCEEFESRKGVPHPNKGEWKQLDEDLKKCNIAVVNNFLGHLIGIANPPHFLCADENTYLECPKCGSRDIDCWDDIFGPMWCNNCGLIVRNQSLDDIFMVYGDDNNNGKQ